MLTDITINNFTIIDKLDLELNPGFTVITGETGAGKSIILDAVNLALGARGDSKTVRPGEKRCLISLSFEIGKNALAKAWLSAHDFSDDECIVQRSITADGKSRSSINGQPCPQSLMREFGELILTIHGQHQHQALLKSETQRQCLDYFADNQPLLEKTRDYFASWQAIDKQLTDLQTKNINKTAEIELLRFQLKELNEASLQADEWHTLSEQHKSLYHAKDIIDLLNESLSFLSDHEFAITSQLAHAENNLSQILKFDARFTNAKQLLSEANIQLDEAVDELNGLKDQLDLDPEALQKTEARLSLLHQLARKHRVEPAELFGVQQRLQKQLTTLEDADQIIEDLKKQQTEIISSYQTVASKLSKARQKSAKLLNKKITEAMQTLSMEGGYFQIDFSARDNAIHPHGNEQVLFMVSTNPGQPLSPMQKVVSGGELSRISLALEVLTASKTQKPVLIFDEVDTGIGGKTADVVGNLLRELGQSAQIFCVTHLPQVAAKGMHQFKVEKIKSKASTRTQIAVLNHQQRIEEIARMLAGSEISDQALKHAEELLSAPIATQ